MAKTAQHARGSRLARSAKSAGRRPLNAARLVDELDDLLRIGDFEAARKKLDGVGPLARIVERLPADQTDRARAAAVLAEVLFTYGHDEDAQALLKGCATHPDAAIGSSLRARHKLQLAEYYYSLFDAEQATALANRILERATEDEVGECCYYLARFALRRNKYHDASEHCIKGMEAFHRSPGKVGNKALFWQTGRLLRVRGTALWLLGRLSESTAVLYLSAWVLRESKAGPIHVGDTLHALGRLLRTSGPDRYEQAIEAVEEARKCYTQSEHGLKRARAETDLARALLNKGLRHQRRNEHEDARSAFHDREEHLAMSLDLTNPHTEDTAPVVWQRERLNALVWSSWLHQEAAAPLSNPAQAFKYAEAAVNLATNIAGGTGPETIEAALAFAHSAMLLAKSTKSDPRSSELLARAETHIQTAATIAKTHENKKLEYHAYLRLAQLRCRQEHDYKDAKEALEQAKASLQKDPEEKLVPDGYLDEQTRLVEAEIANLVRAQKHFLYTEDDLRMLQIPLTTPEKDWSRLKVLRARADKWALDAAIREKGSEADAVLWLDISSAAARNIRKWDEEVTKAQQRSIGAEAEKTLGNSGSEPA